MKKIYTLLAMSCLMATASVSAAPKLGDLDATMMTTPAQRQQLRTMRANAHYDAIHQTNQELYYTRDWVNPRNGDTWTMQFNKEQQPLCEMIYFKDKDGNDFQYTFDELPFYCVTYELYVTDKTSGQIKSDITLQLCWPSYYVWNQVFEWEGDLEDGEIPIEQRDYRCVTPDDLMNSEKWCRKFQESNGIGGEGTADGMNWEYFTCLPNQMLGMPCYVDGEMGYTVVTDARTSSIEFQGYKEDGNIVSFKQVIYCLTESQKSIIVRGDPVGSARLEGFTLRVDDLPEFGDVHLFNVGLGSSDIYADADLFPVEWGPLSQFYLVAADKYIDLYIPEDMRTLDPSALQTVMSDRLPADEDFAFHANVVKGYIYADPKYSTDTTLDPKEETYNIILPHLEYDEAFDTNFVYMKPEANTFFAYGIGTDAMEGWSQEFGIQYRTHNFVNFFDNYAKMGFGTEDGYQFNCIDYYGNMVNAYAPGKCIYHYDPKNVQNVREFDLKSKMEYDSVDVVAADNNATVNALNGVITVSVAEDSNVAIYTLAGATVKSASVKAGNELNVAADKGVYVVVVNGAATKVAL